MKSEFLLGQAASILGVKPYQVIYLLTTGQVPEPSRVGGRRMFCEADLQRLADALGVPFPQNPSQRRESK
jgi:DNA-binding transcriptional MerR regulator